MWRQSPDSLPGRKLCLLAHGTSPPCPGIRWSPEHRGPLTHSPWVCPWCPAQKLSAPWLPGEWKLLASAMFFWSLSPQCERSLGWKQTGQVYPTQQGVSPLSHIPLGAHRTAAASSPQHDTCPQRRRASSPTAQLTWSRNPLQSFLQAGDSVQNPQKFPLLPPLSTTPAKPSA